MDDTLNCITFPLHFSYTIISSEFSRPCLTTRNIFQNSFSNPSVSSTASYFSQRSACPWHSQPSGEGEKWSLPPCSPSFCVWAPRSSRRPLCGTGWPQRAGGTQGQVGTLEHPHKGSQQQVHLFNTTRGSVPSPSPNNVIWLSPDSVICLLNKNPCPSQNQKSPHVINPNPYSVRKTFCIPPELLVCTSLQRSCTVSASLAEVSDALEWVSWKGLCTRALRRCTEECEGWYPCKRCRAVSTWHKEKTQNNSG